MIYDVNTGLVIMFGGVDASIELLNDAWAWNGSQWTTGFRRRLGCV